MLYFPKSNSVFLHAPKTGGTWVRLAVRIAGVACESIEPEHGRLFVAKQRFGRRARYFTVVRHPIAWYRSYWADRNLKAWGGDLEIAHSCQDATFAGFLEKVLVYNPGFLWRLFRGYFDRKGHKVTVGITDSIADDLVKFLQSIDEAFDEAALRSVPPINVGSSYPMFRKLTECDRGLLDRICHAEIELLERFNFDAEPPPYLDERTL